MCSAAAGRSTLRRRRGRSRESGSPTDICKNHALAAAQDAAGSGRATEQDGPELGMRGFSQLGAGPAVAFWGGGVDKKKQPARSSVNGSFWICKTIWLGVVNVWQMGEKIISKYNY